MVSLRMPGSCAPTSLANKLNELVGALKSADKIANGRRVHDYLLPVLRIGSAEATVRARPFKTEPTESPIAYFERATMAVNNGEFRDASSIDNDLIGRIEKLSRGANEQFDHGELSFSGTNIIRIDDYLQRQANDALRTSKHEPVARVQSFRGEVFGTFDGVLQEIDSRGTMLRGKLVLVPNAVEIDCVMNKHTRPRRA